MRFLQIVTADARGTPTPEHMAKVSQAIGELIAAGKLIATGAIGKRATAAARIRQRGVDVTVEEPPAGDDRWMAAGGYSLIEVASKQEAIEDAKRMLAIMGDGVVELIAVSEMHPRTASAPQPSGQAVPGSGVIPYLNLDGASDAAEFYAKAFGAREIARMPAQDGQRLMHCQLEINGGPFMLADVFPEMGVPAEPVSGVTMQLIVRDVDHWWQRALNAGCTVAMPLEVAFWGDKYGQLLDPFGVSWALSEPQR
jgi:uncharacterized glyoxalase superfamily protein PhnB